MRRLLTLLLCCLFIGSAHLLSAQFSISGTVRTSTGEAVPNITVQLSGNVNSTTSTDINGNYLFPDLPAGFDYTVSPIDDLEEANLACLSVQDMLVLAKHVLSEESLSDPYAIIAGDVTNDGIVNSQDIIQLQSIILSEISTFPNNSTWNFIPADYVFPNPATPWAEPYPSAANINDLAGDAVVDFVAIKTGDVTGCPGDEQGPAFLTLSVNNDIVNYQTIQDVDVSVSGFTNVSGLQFSMEWDADLLEFQQVSALNLPGLTANNNFQFTPGSLSFTWVNPNLDGLDLSDGSRLFSIDFKAIGTEGVVPITFTTSPTPFEVLDGECTPFGLDTIGGSLTIDPESVPTALFEKIYGDTLRNTPTKIKQFDDGIYVTGVRQENDVDIATFSKFKRISGDLVWDFQMKEGSIFHDFEYIPETDEFLLIGATEPFQVNGVAQDNESLLIKIDDTGTAVFQRKYQQNGREHFNRIIRHPDPRAPTFPYYIVGTINPPEGPPLYPTAPSSRDRVTVMNIGSDGTVNWAQHYNYDAPGDPEEEFHRGLFAVNTFGGTSGDGDIVILGNDIPANDGLLVKIHGGTGAVLAAKKYVGGLDIYDGQEIVNGRIVLAGTDFANGRAFLSLLDGDFNPIQGLLFEDIQEFREIAVNGRTTAIYTVGPSNLAAPAINYNVIHRVAATPGLVLEYARYLDNGESNFMSPHISVRPNEDAIFYADGRIDNPLGFGNYDLLVGSFDRELNSACRSDFDGSVISFEMTGEDISVIPKVLDLPNPGEIGMTDLDYKEDLFCASATCSVSFTWDVQACGVVQFTPQFDGNGSIAAYDWDINCDGTSESEEANPELLLPICEEAVAVCLTVTLEDGTTCDYKTTIDLPADLIPPTISPMTDISVSGTTENCTAFVTIPIPEVTDDCGPITLANNINGEADASGEFPQGTTIVTFTATDACGNSAEMQINVTVGCRNCGEAVITCFPGFSGNNPSAGVDANPPVLGIVDIRNYGAYAAGSYLDELSGNNIYHPGAWNYNNLGLVFGLAIDRDQNIYAASTTIFGCSEELGGDSPFGPTDRARIYKIDPSDQITVLIEQGSFSEGENTIPANGAGYGNICYDPDHHQLFATNFHDGYIYRIDLNTSTVVDRFDPFQGDNTPSNDDTNFTALGQRPWGIAYNKLDKRLYYSKWNEDRGRRKDGEKNEIWSIEIDPVSGGFSGIDVPEIELDHHIDTYSPDSPNLQDYSNPVSDIAFSEEGLMLVAERSMQWDCGDATRLPFNSYFRWYSHQARVLEYQFDGQAWNLTPGHGPTPFTDYATQLKYQLGSSHPSEGATTAGGVDYGYPSFDPSTGENPQDCDQMMWASGDCIQCSDSENCLYYGIQGIPIEGGDACDGYAIDFDGLATTANKVQQGDVEIFKCLDCPPTTCRVNIRWEETSCGTVQLSAVPTTNLAVTGYAWDINCDEELDSEEENTVWDFGVCNGEYSVCLTITLEDGTTCSQEQTIILPGDSESPEVNCPDNFNISTDAGLCYASLSEIPIITDNCDPAPTATYTWSGADEGTSNTLPTQWALGTTVVTVMATDQCGNESTACNYTITVTDEEAPQISCPSSVNVSVPGCSAGEIVNFEEAIALDNCGVASIIYSHESGEFFSCGNTEVTATATDEAGNPSSCAFSVAVNGCQNCAEVSGDITCGPEPGVYEFSLVVENLTTLSAPETITVEGPGDITFNWEVDENNPSLVLVEGTIEVALPLPTALELEVSVGFDCDLGPISCTLPLMLTPPCCEKITVADTAVCSQEELITISMEGDLSYLSGISNVKWYISVDCSDTYFLFQESGPEMMDLAFPPYLFDTYESVCLFAEVSMSGHPCSKLTTNIATLILCDPVSGLITNDNPDYCSNALPGVYQPLIYNSDNNPDCDYTIQWYQNGQLISGANSDSYQPSGLAFTGGSEECYTEHLFVARVGNLCDTVNVSTTIRIYNENAPVGELILDPEEPMPFCPKEDATLRFDPKCVGPDSLKWTWHISNDNITYSEIPGAGMINPLYNTNQLWIDTWYQVQGSNGVCPAQTSTFMIDIQEPFEIVSFTAQPDNICAPEAVQMNINLSPITTNGCEYLIRWYKDGILLESTTTVTASASYTHLGPVLAGNYYAVVEGTCCGQVLQTVVVSIPPAMEVLLLAPCFRCKEASVSLTGVVVHPPGNSTCTYQWYADGVPIPQATEEVLLVEEGNITYTFEANCGGCVRQVSYYLRQCDGTVSINEHLLPPGSVKIHPNPTSGQLQLRFAEQIREESHLQIVDQLGQVILLDVLSAGQTEYELSLDHLPSGAYWLHLIQEGRMIWREGIVRQ